MKSFVLKKKVELTLLVVIENQMTHDNCGTGIRVKILTAPHVEQ